MAIAVAHHRLLDRGRLISAQPRALGLHRPRCPASWPVRPHAEALRPRRALRFWRALPPGCVPQQPVDLELARLC